MMSNDINYPTCTPGNVLVEPIDSPSEVGGIHNPNAENQRSQEGKVLSIGATRKDDELLAPCGVGDVIIFKQWTGSEYKFNGKKLLFLDFRDIKGIK